MRFVDIVNFGILEAKRSRRERKREKEGKREISAVVTRDTP